MVLISGFSFKRVMIPLQRFTRVGTAALRSRAIARSLLSDGWGGMVNVVMNNGVRRRDERERDSDNEQKEIDYELGT